MPPLLAFGLGFLCCGLLGLLYLLSQFLQIMRELLEMLRDELKDS